MNHINKMILEYMEHFRVYTNLGNQGWHTQVNDRYLDNNYFLLCAVGCHDQCEAHSKLVQFFTF